MEKAHNFFEALGNSSEIIGVATFKALSYAVGVIGVVAVLTIASKWLIGELLMDWGAFLS